MSTPTSYVAGTRRAKPSKSQFDAMTASAPDSYPGTREALIAVGAIMVTAPLALLLDDGDPLQFEDGSYLEFSA